MTQVPLKDNIPRELRLRKKVMDCENPRIDEDGGGATGRRDHSLLARDIHRPYNSMAVAVYVRPG
jgi:hypothetical protein